MKLFQKIGALALAGVMLATALPVAHGAKSDEIRDQINALEADQQVIQSQMDDIRQQQDANWTDIEEMVAYKSSVDQEIFLLYTELDNLNQQITAYTMLIAQTQAELDLAQEALDELTVRYRERVRAMEEEGTMSYWEVLFKAKSFTDLIDRLNMVREIAEADQRLIDQMRQATVEVAQTKASLEGEKASLEASRDAQELSQAALEEKRAESDRVLRELNENHREMEALHAEFDAQKAELAAEIAKAEKEYNEAKRAEEEAKRREEEEKRKEEEANKPKPPESGSGGEEEDDTPSTPPPSADSGWRQPCSYTYISSAYGKRGSGWHNGVDFAAPRGTPIYASRSGTVTTAKSLTYSYGNYLVVNHGDGFSSLYAHMDYYVVSQGQYVSQGQLIGYVGSTGNSSGNHLHFTIFYEGSDVNPMNYL